MLKTCYIFNGFNSGNHFIVIIRGWELKKGDNILKQLGFLFHIDQCIGCYSCRFACHNEHHRTGVYRRKIHSFQDEQYRKTHSFQHISMSCNHCETPACLAACHVGAIQKKQNGVVLINKTKCTGCKKCEPACPFDAIHIDPLSGKADKCDMCYDRLMQGETTICASNCPVQAIEIINMNDPKNEKYEQEAYGFEMKKVTNPSIRFTQRKNQQVKRFWSNI